MVAEREAPYDRCHDNEDSLHPQNDPDEWIAEQLFHGHSSRATQWAAQAEVCVKGKTGKIFLFQVCYCNMGEQQGFSTGFGSINSARVRSGS
jgi:hypothetical protein